MTIHVRRGHLARETRVGRATTWPTAVTLSNHARTGLGKGAAVCERHCSPDQDGPRLPVEARRVPSCAQPAHLRAGIPAGPGGQWYGLVLIENPYGRRATTKGALV